MKTNTFLQWSIGLVGGCLSALAIADAAGDAARYYEDALSRYERRDDAGAVIQLKNALRQDSRMLPALVLLGQAYLRRGEPAAAENVLADAERMGAARAQIAGFQAQAYYDQGKRAALLEKFSADGLPPAQRVTILLLRARAQLELGQYDAALSTARAVTRIPGGETRALALLAQIELNAGRADAARALIQQALQRAPRDAEALTLLASVAHAEGALDAALRDYTRALTIDPGQRDARLARAAILLDLNRETAAKTDIDYLQKHFPADPRALYLRALYFERRGDLRQMRPAMQETAQSIDRLPQAFVAGSEQLQMLGGLAHYALQEYERAARYLEPYLSRRAGAIGARKLLAGIYLAQRRYGRVITVLQPALNASPVDARVLSLLAEAYMAQGNHIKAASLFQEATRADSDAALQTGLGVSLLGAGQGEAGFAALERAYRQGGAGSQAAVPLALTYLQRGEARRAIPIVEALVKREPKNLSAWNLLGMAHQAAGDRAGARAAYSAAIQAAPGFYIAHLNLARLDETEGQVARARQRYLGILKVAPTQSEAMLELGRLEENAGHLPEAIRWLEKAGSLRAQDLRPRLALHALYMRQARPQRALDAAKDAHALAPDNPATLMALAQSQIAIGNFELARVSLRRLVQVVAFDAARLVQVAALQLRAADIESARYTLSKALLANPDFVAARILQVRMDLPSGDLRRAEKNAVALLTQHPTSPAVQQVMGELRLAQKRYREAIAAYRAAHLARPDLSTLFGLYNALRADGQTAEAARLAAAWYQAHPQDRAAAHALGEAWMAMHKSAEARTVYQALVRSDARDARAHNNLATLLLQTGNVAAALKSAEHAQRLAPNQPQVNDTLGWILIQGGQFDKGMRYLREAILRAPDDAQIQAHLDAALALRKPARIRAQ